MKHSCSPKTVATKHKKGKIGTRDSHPVPDGSTEHAQLCLSSWCGWSTLSNSGMTDLGRSKEDSNLFFLCSLPAENGEKGHPALNWREGGRMFSRREKQTGKRPLNLSNSTYETSRVLTIRCLNLSRLQRVYRSNAWNCYYVRRGISVLAYTSLR